MKKALTGALLAQRAEAEPHPASKPPLDTNMDVTFAIY